MEHNEPLTTNVPERVRLGRRGLPRPEDTENEQIYARAARTIAAPAQFAPSEPTNDTDTMGNYRHSRESSMRILQTEDRRTAPSMPITVIGPTGPTGPVGPAGPIGLRGEQGLPGINGKDGKDGRDGKDGLNGLNGIDGKNGKDGKNGIDGKDGLNGLNGIDGKDGAEGKMGPTGPMGPIGPRGEQGERGAQGPQGSIGRPGIQGAQGEKGDKGERGENGATGPTGPMGVPGTIGHKGDTGATGPTGPAGVAGPRGATGPTGAAGEANDTYGMAYQFNNPNMNAALTRQLIPLKSVGKSRRVEQNSGLSIREDGVYEVAYVAAIARCDTVCEGSVFILHNGKRLEDSELTQPVGLMASGGEPIPTLFAGQTVIALKGGDSVKLGYDSKGKMYLANGRAASLYARKLNGKA